METTQHKMRQLLAYFLYSTGVFAIVGALYTWGDGSIFLAPPDMDLSLFIADLALAGPASFIAGYGIWTRKSWAPNVSWFVSGIYLYGSVAVYAKVFTAGSPYPLDLVIPPIFGIILSITLIVWTWKHRSLFQTSEAPVERRQVDYALSISPST